MNESPQDFYKESVQPALKVLKGPVSSFEIPSESLSAIRDRAIETGHIEEGVFSNVPLFDDISERQARQKAKTAKEILDIVAVSDAFPDNPNNAAAMLHAEGELAAASLVEGARMLKVASHEPNRHLAMYASEIDRAQEVLYGSLDEELDAACVAAVLKLRPEHAELSNPLRDSYLEKYPWAANLKGEMPYITAEKMAEYSAELHERYTPIFFMLRTEFNEISNDNLVAIMDRYLELRGYSEKGWTCVENLNRAGMFVNGGKNTVESGKRSIPITWSRFEQLAMHEIEFHLARTQNARDHNALPLSTAVLPGLADAEEGGGLVMELLWSGKAVQELPGRDVYRYMAIAYADGRYDGEKHTEEETYEFIVESMTLSAVSRNGTDIDEERNKARKASFDHVFRAFRGMPPGKVMLRNAGYLIGKKKMIDIINTTDKPASEVIDYLQQAKTDPTNPVHEQLRETYKLTTL